MKALSRPVGLAQDIAAKRIIKRFAVRFGFVYFGRVDHWTDQQQLVQGVTAMGTHTDRNYAVGAFRGHDITVVERRNRLHLPGKEPRYYRWLIMQIDLKREGLPHVFVDGHHHDGIFYHDLFIAFADFENAARLFVQHDRLFMQHFKVFAPLGVFDAVADMLQPSMTAMLAHHFRQFDYEIIDDRLLVYATNTAITPRLLPEMLRVGLWLADQLNAAEL